MPIHDLSGGGDVLDRTAACAAGALASYGCHPGTTVRLLNVSENATYLLDDPDDGVSVLRVHRHGYHTTTEITSELAWMDALRQEAGVRTPRVLPASDGRRVVLAADGAGGEPRACVRFEFLPGTEPGADSAHFEELGELTARMHRHSRQWRRPPWLTRFHWDWAAAFGPGPRWGSWQAAPGVGPAESDLLTRLEQVLRFRLTRFGTGPDRYGLVHADTRLANLLVHEGTVSVIDFDDAGFGWFLYDAATSVSFFETEPRVPDLLDTWLNGYRRELPLPAADAAELATFVAFRRLLLTAWIGSHHAVQTARELGPAYARGTCDLAESYLTRFA